MGRAGRQDHIVTVQRVIDAPPSVIFSVLTDPSRHADIDGSGMVLGKAEGAQRLSLGAKFSLGMHQSVLRYRSLSQVVEFEQDRVIAWRSGGQWRGHWIIGGQTWRYELFDGGDPASHGDQPGDEPATTLVRHSYDWGSATTPLLLQLGGYPRRMRAAMPRSLQRLAETVAAIV